MVTQGEAAMGAGRALEVLRGAALLLAVGVLVCADEPLARLLDAQQKWQSWGPPWEAAHLRWTAVLLAALAVLVEGLADASTARRPALPVRRGDSR